MKRSIVSVAMAVSLSAISFNLNAAIITLSPSATDIKIGNSVAVDLIISDIPEEYAIGAFDLTIGYDQNVLQFEKILSSPDLTEFEYTPTINDGNVNILAFSGYTGDLPQTASGISLGTLIFKGISSGFSDISFVNVESSIVGDQFADNSLPLEQLTGTSVSVPEPAITTLFSFGLLFTTFLGLYRRKEC
jgi:hypothetical protein